MAALLPAVIEVLRRMVPAETTTVREPTSRSIKAFCALVITEPADCSEAPHEAFSSVTYTLLACCSGLLVNQSSRYAPFANSTCVKQHVKLLDLHMLVNKHQCCQKGLG